MASLDDKEREASAAVYNAHPLRLDSSKCIRLIKVLPYASIEDSLSNILSIDTSLITVEIRTVPLKNAPPYIALSYMWGPPEPSRVINLAGQPFTIRDNIWGFLDRVSQGEDLGFFWIDALCIDQSSIPERNHQVAMMGDIYHRATQVISWLGVGPPELVEAVRGLSPFLREWWETEVDGKIRRHSLTLRDAQYWCRAWIVQEVVLAQDIQVWCGKESMSRTSLEHWSRLQRGGTELTWRLRSMFNKVGIFNVDGMDIATVLRYFGSDLGECADVRDRIYSVLSLVSPEELVKYPIVVDYDKPPYKLYLDLVEISRRQGRPKIVQYRDAVTLRTTLELHADSRVSQTILELKQKRRGELKAKRTKNNNAFII